ncbi:OsmC family protein [Endozoicomonas numazuensis]|uniref:Osmotically inducible protein OsmC n=1 Tax=Endozoicomonas numazuensis TaxID=1137799 RepID=A0A081NGA0_9GAMM|nr:OsmC family protein [Endozoicomonas numazuensis]KEQ17473.1 osmotically inducible protein OsmC [Endozoicomonas numazuensis]
MKAQVKWVDQERFLGLTDSNNSVVMDADKSVKSAPSPMELILMGLGGCSSVDVIGILEKARQKVVDCHVDIQAERADSVPAVFTKIHLNFVVKGTAIKEAHVKRAVELSADKYCSVAMMLGKGGVEITHNYEIIEA